jgi:ubiquinone/menaquinone biosynthesis C-methylase UbiE
VAADTLLDVGCSAGVSTRYLKDRFPGARRVMGLDLSPHFLTVASLREKEAPRGIEYLHAKAEATGLEAQSVDLAMVTFLIHELPTAATREVLAEMFRVLRPGGVVALTDNDPRSPVIQKLPKPIAILMVSFSAAYQTSTCLSLHWCGWINPVLLLIPPAMSPAWSLQKSSLCPC